MHLCTIEGCEKKLLSRGYCAAHYYRWRKYGTTDDSALAFQRHAGTPLERFEAKRIIRDDGCWGWAGTIDPQTGYSRMVIDKKMVGVHRWAYEEFVGPIPPGLSIDHLCRNRWCVNPACMEPVTIAENTRRAPGSQSTINAAKTHCIRGHPFKGDNLRITTKGTRQCRTCDGIRDRRRYDRL